MTEKLPNYSWIKFEIDYLNSVEFMTLSEAAAACYLKLYLLAGKSDAGGLLCDGRRAYSLKDLAFMLRTRESDLNTPVAELIEAGLIDHNTGGYCVSRFMDEQGPGKDADRGAWRDRQAKHRAKLKVKNSEQEQEKEQEKEKNRTEQERGRDVTVTSGYVTVTQKPVVVSVFSSSFFESLPENYRSIGDAQSKKLADFVNEYGEAKVIDVLMWADRESKSFDHAMNILPKVLPTWQATEATQHPAPAPVDDYKSMADLIAERAKEHNESEEELAQRREVSDLLQTFIRCSKVEPVGVIEKEAWRKEFLYMAQKNVKSKHVEAEINYIRNIEGKRTVTAPSSIKAGCIDRAAVDRAHEENYPTRPPAPAAPPPTHSEEEPLF